MPDQPEYRDPWNKELVDDEDDMTQLAHLEELELNLLQAEVAHAIDVETGLRAILGDEYMDRRMGDPSDVTARPASGTQPPTP